MLISDWIPAITQTKINSHMILVCFISHRK